jgi:signal transduction histidine kinase
MDPINILMVDDQPAKLMSYEVMLKELGENLIKASSAREALECLLKTDVAVILVDVCMPEQDGFELVRMIREHPRFEKIAIIFVSAIAMAEPDRLRGYKAGAVDYVSVPVVPDLLRAKVRVFAELHRKTRALELLNSELENRVTRRTHELSETASKLQSLNDELEHRIEQRTREREQALAQLFEAQKLDAIGHLTGGVAHDFNNLLMAILGSLELVQKRNTDERIRQLVDNAIAAAGRGASLTKRLLAFARRQALEPQDVNLTELLRGTANILERTLGPVIDLELDVPAGIGVRVDPNQLELAIMNLCINARDAMPEGGSIKIAARTKSSSQTPSLEGNFVELTVTDTGYGMDPATLARATEPFFTTKGIGKGTGLGLSMVHGLCGQSGGQMKLSSKLGEGTQVTMWLPEAMVVAAEATVTISQRPAGPGKRMRVLMVDDDALVSMGAGAMLEDLGHDVVECYSALDALKALRSEANFDLVITDHAMPGMTGLELARTIQGTWPHIPIIIASGFSEVGAGPDLTRLDKPYDQHALSEALIAASRNHAR